MLIIKNSFSFMWKHGNFLSASGSSPKHNAVENAVPKNPQSVAVCFCVFWTLKLNLPAESFVDVFGKSSFRGSPKEGSILVLFRLSKIQMSSFSIKVHLLHTPSDSVD